MTGLVFIGVIMFGGAGAAWRAIIAKRANAISGGWPVGTFVVNIGASFALGLLHGRAGEFATILGVGFLGALSTWSSLAHEAAELLRSGRRATVAGYVVATLVLGIGAAWSGLQI